jgi:hypothetical protein
MLDIHATDQVVVERDRRALDLSKMRTEGVEFLPAGYCAVSASVFRACSYLGCDSMLPVWPIFRFTPEFRDDSLIGARDVRKRRYFTVFSL